MPPARELSVYEFLSAELGAEWDERTGAFGWLRCPVNQSKVRILFELSESRFSFTLSNILVAGPDNRGQGLGSTAVAALRDYADASGKSFRVTEIEHPTFFERFDFWTDYIGPDPEDELDKGEAEYAPERSAVAG